MVEPLVEVLEQNKWANLGYRGAEIELGWRLEGSCHRCYAKGSV